MSQEIYEFDLETIFKNMADQLEKCHADPEWCRRMDKAAADDFYNEMEED